MVAAPAQATGPTGGSRTSLTWVAVGAAVAGLLGFPILAGASGIASLAFFAAAFFVVGVPLLLGEASLGQFRRRNVVDTFGPGAWRVAGYAFVGISLLAAAAVAVVAGWSARYVFDSFEGAFYDDPARHFRLVAAGSDALLAAFVALAAATGAALYGVRKGLRGLAAATVIGVLVVLAGLLAYAVTAGGGVAGLRQAVRWPQDGIDGPGALQAILLAPLAALGGLGVTATMAARGHDSRLPGHVTAATAALLGLPLLASLVVAALADGQGFALATGGDWVALFRDVPAVFAAVGGTAGGVLAGLFFGSLLAICLAALVVLLDVPAMWLRERWPAWTPKRSILASALLVALLAVPFCFGLRVQSLHAFLLGVVAPLGGLAVSIHVGWVRADVMDGLRVGDANHRLNVTLRPWLRFVVPAALAFLLLIGTMAWLNEAGWLTRGSGGLWSLVP